MNIWITIFLPIVIFFLIFLISKTTYIFIKIFLIILIIVGSTIWFFHFNKKKTTKFNFTTPKEDSSSSEYSPKGICYFDIDDTLTTAVDNPDDIIDECLKNNFAVGISTASGRTLSNICNAENPTEPWMSSKLCKQFNKDPRLFNSATVLAGKPHSFDKNLFDNISSDRLQKLGGMKAYHMKYGRDTIYPNIPDKCVVLFDDNTDFMHGVKKIAPHMNTECSGSDCGGHIRLSKDLVKNKIKDMINSGC